MKMLPSALMLAMVLAAPLAPVQAQSNPHGPYFVAALGLSHINYDCGIYYSCNSATAATGKLLGGYRFGVWATEVWYADYGKTDVGDAYRGPIDMRVTGAGVGLAWYMHFEESWKGLMRAGVAQVKQTRADDGSRTAWQATFGLGAIYEMTPTAGLELAWDLTTADGNNTSSSIVNAFTLGLRLRF